MHVPSHGRLVVGAEGGTEGRAGHRGRTDERACHPPGGLVEIAVASDLAPAVGRDDELEPERRGPGTSARIPAPAHASNSADRAGGLAQRDCARGRSAPLIASAP